MAAAMKKEADVKKEIKTLFKTLELWHFMPSMSGYGTQGVPDFVGVSHGRGFAIETKFGKNTTTDWQNIQIAAIRAAGGKVWVVNEKNIENFRTEFSEWAANASH